LSELDDSYHTSELLDDAELAAAVDILQIDGIKTVGTRASRPRSDD
jgi:hypothetical protein